MIPKYKFIFLVIWNPEPRAASPPSRRKRGRKRRDFSGGVIWRRGKLRFGVRSELGDPDDGGG